MYFLQLRVEFETGHVQRREIISRCFRPADQLETAVLAKQNFRGTELTVVIVTHGMTMGTGIMDHKDISDVDGRQAALDGKFVIVLAQAAGHVINMIQDCIFLAQNSDMVVRAVHGRTHQVRSTGINTDVFPVNVLLVRLQTLYLSVSPR